MAIHLSDRNATDGITGREYEIAVCGAETRDGQGAQSGQVVVKVSEFEHLVAADAKGLCDDCKSNYEAAS